MSDKRLCAVMTIVRNESVFLPIWYKYYNRFFDKQDIYVIDDSSFDGSTDFLEPTQIHKIHNEYAYSHEYLKNNVISFRKQLLQKYEYVVFAEVDEILYHIELTLDQFVKQVSDAGLNYVTANGWELFHDPNVAARIDLNRKIMEQRHYWFHHPMYDKLLISNKELPWTIGFHFVEGIDKTQYIDPHLYLIHLHRFDYFLHKERKLFFAKHYKHNDVPSWGCQNKLKTEQEIDSFYFAIPYKAEQIPMSFRTAF